MSHTLSHITPTLTETGAARGPGLIAPRDPRLRVLLACLFAIVVVGLSGLVALTAALGVSLGLLAVSRLPVRRTLRRMAMMDGFILFMLALLPFTVPGDVMFTLWGFDATWQGLARAVEIGLTANAVVLALIVLVGTIEPVTLGHALHHLKMPETLVHLLMFTVRYIEVLREEYLRLRQAMKVRGFRPGTNWHTYRSFGYLVGRMLVRAIERSERIMAAMKCRGFSGRLMLLRRFRMTPQDWAFGAGFAALCLALIGVELTWR